MLTSIWIIFLVVVTFTYARLSAQAVKVAMLQKENRELREYQTRVIDIEKSFKRNQELTARLAEMAGVNLQNLRSPAEIPLDSLGMATSGGMSTAAVGVTQTDTNLTTEELAAQRVPYGRPLYGWITRTFISKGDNESLHSGIDFAVKEGTNVSATAAGVVISAGWDDVLGNYVVIDHENGGKDYGDAAGCLQGSRDAGRGSAHQQSGRQSGQSGSINDEIRRLRSKHQEIPLYAVVEDVCASGGYYVAAAADKIFVDKASIVGSIGVLMDGFIYRDNGQAGGRAAPADCRGEQGLSGSILGAGCAAQGTRADIA